MLRTLFKQNYLYGNALSSIMEFNINIIKIINETYDTKTFVFAKPNNFEFVSGQYCMLSFKGDETAKPFTFSSSPDNENLEITIKKIGKFTEKIHDSKQGDELILRGPFGTALNYEPEKDAIFIAGGSGITPFISAIRYAKHIKNKKTIILFYANREEKDIIFREELENSGVQIIFVLTKVSDNKWNGETGYISEELILKYVNPDAQAWYISGPPIMNKALKNILTQLGVNDIRVEPWEIEGKST